MSLIWQKVGNDLIVTLPGTPVNTILPVIKVVLDGQPHVIPERTIQSVYDDM